MEEAGGGLRPAGYNQVLSLVTARGRLKGSGSREAGRGG